jgi:hypothetical protein
LTSDRKENTIQEISKIGEAALQMSRAMMLRKISYVPYENEAILEVVREFTSVP